MRAMASELREARSGEEAAQRQCASQREQVERWAADVSKKFYGERQQLIDELRSARQELGNMRFQGRGGAQAPAWDNSRHHAGEGVLRGPTASVHRGKHDGGAYVRVHRVELPPGLDQVAVRPPAATGIITEHTASGSDDAFEDEIRRRRGSVKSIALGPIPNATGFRRWLHEMYIQVCAASKTSQRRTMPWLKEVETKGLSEIEAP